MPGDQDWNVLYIEMFVLFYIVLKYMKLKMRDIEIQKNNYSATKKYLE